MRITTIICDRCKKSVTSEDPKEVQDAFDIKLVGVAIVDDKSYGYYYNNVPQASLYQNAMWCANCRTELKLAERPTDDKPIEGPSLPDQLVEIIRTIAQDVVDYNKS